MDVAPAARILLPSGRSTFSSPSTVAGGDQRDVRVDEKDGGQPEVGGAVLLTDSDAVGVGVMGQPLATAAHRSPPRPRVSAIARTPASTRTVGSAPGRGRRPR
jgi:hypothetical protein